MSDPAEDMNKELSPDSFDWEDYFSAEKNGLFQSLLMIHRRLFIAPCVRRWFNRVFPREGIFVEAGAGTSESSGKIDKYERNLIALDFCGYVLSKMNVLPGKVQGDIFALPFVDSSVDGIWNLGVMEHFNDDQIIDIFKEFRRVLKTNGKILILWPPWFALHELVLNSISKMIKVVSGKHVEFFPNEINLYDKREKVQSLMQKAGFRMEQTSFGPRDLFSYVIIVASPEKTA